MGTRYITSAELLIQQSAETDAEIANSVYNGELVTYTISVENLGTTDLDSIEITDLLPSGALEQSSVTCSPTCRRVTESKTIPEPSGGTVVISTTQQLIWDLASLSSMETYTVSFSGRVVGQMEGSVLTNRLFARYFSDGVEQAASGEDLALTTLLRVSSAGEASISSVPTWFSEDSGGTIAQDWGDFDLDGDLDLALGSSLGTSVYRNDAGSLTLVWRSPMRDDGTPRLSYGVRWADVIPDAQNRPELIVVGDSGNQTATDEGLNYIYAYNSVERDFSEAETFVSHLQLVRLVTGDFDGDGDVDLIGSTNAINGVVRTPFQTLCPVNLYRNDGQGGFMGTVEMTETHAVRCISENATAALGVCDYDADGDLDLALGEFPSSLTIMENMRDGRVLTDTDFLNETSSLLLEVDLEYLPYDLSWADYDADGAPELAAAYPIQREARIYDQDSGTFGHVSIIRTATFMTPLSVDWGDFNGDGRVDLVVADTAPQFYSYVADVGFRRLAALDVEVTSGEGQIWSVHGIELGNRQNLDLAMSNRDGPSRLYTVSTPKLATGLTSVSDKHASSVAWGDADGNGDQDLLLGSASLADMGFSSHLYLNRKGAFYAFNEREFGPSGFGPHAVAFGDIDLDGELEIAIGTPTSIQIYQEGEFESTYQQIAAPGGVRSLAWGDANDDGRLDLLAGFAGGPVRLYFNAGNRLDSTAVVTTPHAGEALALAWGDVDGDYYLDFVVGFADQPLEVYQNDGDATFSLAWRSPVTLPVQALALGDYDADGDLDLAVGNGVGTPDQLWENENGDFGTAPVWVTDVATATTTAVAWGDWESNGELDLAIGRDGQEDIIYANLGSRPGVPQFAKLWSSDALSRTTGLAWGDADGDGDLDLGVSHRDGLSGYYENTLIIRDAVPLADNPPYVHVARPGVAQDGYFYSGPEILGGPGESLVTISYVVYDPESDPINHVWFEYSLSGGTVWQPATPAPTSPAPITQTSPTGTPALFIWDAAADDAVSDNARFRVRVTSHKESGPLQDIDGSGISAPFRVRGLDCYWPAGASILTDPLTPTLGAETIFEGRVAFANGPVTYHWDFGDGETAVGWRVPHTYATNGTYTVTLQVYGEACPIARPAFIEKQLEVSGALIYLPLVMRNYTDTTTTEVILSPDLDSRPFPDSYSAPSNVRDGRMADNIISYSRTLTTAASEQSPQANLQAQSPDLLQLTNYAFGINNQPAMSGDGNRVAFWSTGRLTGQNLDGNIEIFLAEIGEGGSVDYTQITSSTGTILGGFNLYPAVDQTGDRIVFFSDRDLTGGNADQNFEVFLAEIQTDGTPILTQITYTEDGVNILPDISNNGRFITFVSDSDLVGDGHLLPGEMNIFRANITDPQNIIFTQITQGAVFSDEPAISGDGALITFVSDQDLTGDNADGNAEIFVARVAGGSITYQQVTHTTTGLNEQPDLSTAGTRLIYLSSGDVTGGARRLYRVDVDPITLALSASQQLGAAPLAGDLDRATISGDGTRVAYYAVAERDVYIYDLVDDDTKERTQRISTYPSLSNGGTQLAFASDGKIYVKSYPLADLSLGKTSVVTQVVAGDRLTYTLTLTNSGPSAGTGLVLTDNLPQGVTSLLPDSVVRPVQYVPPLTVTHRNHFDLPNYWSANEVDAWMSRNNTQHLYHLEYVTYGYPPGFVELTHYTRDDGLNYFPGSLECNYLNNECPQDEPAGKIDGALRFDGNNDRLVSKGSENPGFGSLTVSFWAKSEGTDYYKAHVVYQYSTGMYGWRFDVGFYSDDRFYCYLGYGSELTTAPYPDTGWHHWACAYDATTDERTIYRDGVPVAQDVTSFSGRNDYKTVVGDRFKGVLDEIAIYENRVLTPDEIRFQYEQQAPARTSPIDYYDANYAAYYSDVLTDPLGLGLWGMLQWLPGRISGEPLPDNQGADAYPTSVEGRLDMTDNILLLHLDEPEGTTSFLDASGSGNDASCEGSNCPQAIPGRFNGALRFDGKDDALNLPGYIPEKEDFTFATWVYWNGGSGQHIFDLGRDVDNHLYLSPLEDGQLRFSVIQDGAEQSVQGPALPRGSWSHLAVTLQADLATVWLDGERLVTGTITISPEDVLGDQTWLGRTLTGWSSYFDGRMDEVALFTRALDADEIRNHYLRGATQIALQVRTCDDPGCQNDPFVGLDGSRADTFTAADDAGSELPTFALSDLPANPYFQYRVLMSSYTTLTTPSLISVTVRPQVTCEGQGTETVTCQAGTEAAPFPAGRDFTLMLPTVVDNTAYLSAGKSAGGSIIITNTARLDNRESDHDADDNEARLSTMLGAVVVEQVVLTGPADVATDAYATLTATVTPDNVSSPITYTWETDLGKSIVYTGTAETTVTQVFSWTQAEAGTRVITVNVDNGMGSVVSDTHSIAVVIPITDPKLSVNPTVEVGSSTTMTATVAEGCPVTYDWAFGDGTTTTQGPISSTESIVTHAYAASGTYPVIVHFSNPSSAFTRTAFITVTNVPIADLKMINDGPTELSNPTMLTVTKSAGTGVTLDWDFGDGDTLVSSPSDGATAAVRAHTYSHIGNYTAIVTATNGASTDVVKTTVEVTEEPLTGLTLNSDAPQNHQETVSLAAHLDSGTNVSYTWDFGDGSPVVENFYTHVGAAGPSEVQQTHVYTTYKPQTLYTAVVTATSSTGVLTAETPVTITRHCWAGIEGQSADYDVVQDAIDAAAPHDLVKVAGTCDTVSQRAGRSQVAYLSKTLTLRGGYSYTLGVANPISYPTTLDAQEAGARALRGSGITVTVADLRLARGDHWRWRRGRGRIRGRLDAHPDPRHHHRLYHPLLWRWPVCPEQHAQHFG